jgi:hypothetical protein
MLYLSKLSTDLTEDNKLFLALPVYLIYLKLMGTYYLKSILDELKVNLA